MVDFLISGIVLLLGHQGLKLAAQQVCGMNVAGNKLSKWVKILAKFYLTIITTRFDYMKEHICLASKI